MFVWAVAEATLWPIIPDFLLVPLVAGRRRRPATALLASIAGMALGGTAGYLVAYRFPQRACALMHRVPLTDPTDVEVVTERLRRRGPAAFLGQPYSGIPMKAWAVAGAICHISPLHATPLFVAARATRMVLVAALTQLLVTQFHRTWRDHFLLLTTLYVTLFFGIWGRMLRRRPQPRHS